MTYRDTPLWNYALIGAGAGALSGTLVGLLATRRAPPPAPAAIAEGVEDLKRRAAQILSELSGADAAPDPSAPMRPMIDETVKETAT